MKESSLFDISGKTALVTGGAIGIGRALAMALAKGGANVAIVDLDEETGTQTVTSIRSMGVESVFVRCDVSDAAQVQHMMLAVVERFGNLDIGVNNAGFGINCGAEQLAKSEWDRVVGVNLTGVFLCAQSQAQHMLREQRSGGKIINIASIYGLIAGGNCAYNAAKAGVIHLTKSLAAEFGRYNINVNCISPGWVLTPGNPIDAGLRARMREVTPLGYVQRPEDLQGAILFLASKASDFITGHNLIIDGGHSLNTWLRPLEREMPARVTPDEEDLAEGYW